MQLFFSYTINFLQVNKTNMVTRIPTIIIDLKKLTNPSIMNTIRNISFLSVVIFLVKINEMKNS